MVTINTSFRTIANMLEEVNKNETLLRTIAEQQGHKGLYAMSLIVYNECWGYNNIINHFIREIRNFPEIKNKKDDDFDYWQGEVEQILRKIESIRVVLARAQIVDDVLMEKIANRCFKSEEFLDKVKMFVHNCLYDALTKFVREEARK
jgi:hypothetical protein